MPIISVYYKVFYIMTREFQNVGKASRRLGKLYIKKLPINKEVCFVL